MKNILKYIFKSPTLGGILLEFFSLCFYFFSKVKKDNILNLKNFFFYRLILFGLKVNFINLCLHGDFITAYKRKSKIFKKIYSIVHKNTKKDRLEYLIWKRIFQYGAVDLGAENDIHQRNLSVLEHELFELIYSYSQLEPCLEEGFNPDAYLKVVGPLDTDEALELRFDQYILTKPRSGFGWKDRRGILLPNNYSLKNHQFLISQFLEDCPEFHLVCSPSASSVLEWEAAFTFGGGFGSAMGLTRSLFCAYSHGAKRIDCSGFDFYLGEKKYGSSYLSSISSKPDLGQIVSRSNYSHDLLFNFLISRVLVKYAFVDVVGPIKDIVSLEPRMFLQAFHASNYREG